MVCHEIGMKTLTDGVYLEGLLGEERFAMRLE